MTDKNKIVLETLRFILSKIKDLELDWVLVGSTNLVVQGIDIIAKDIDIITTANDAKIFYRLFEEFGIQEVSYSSTDKYRSHFGKLMIEDVLVEIMAELEYKTAEKVWMKSTSLRDKIEVRFGEYLVPVIPLESEVQFYKLMNRPNDSRKIDAISKQNRKDY